MESPSQAPYSGGSPLKGLLLTASILSCWIQPTSAQSASVTVVPNPPYGTVGSSVILEIQGISEQPSSYTWHKRTVGNQIAFYRVFDGHLTTSDSRLNVFSSGSLLISNLCLNDTNNYTVQFYNSTTAHIESAQGYLVVYGKMTQGGSNGSSLSGGTMAGMVIGVLAGVALTGALIYFLFFRKTGRVSKQPLSEKNSSTPKHGKDTILYENTVFPKGSTLLFPPPQGLSSSPVFPEILSESSYQALDRTQVDAYDKINPWKSCQIQGRRKSP
ncbi:cell adhesion molecule CEACAM4-like [Notamacropus eugenii]|uniref:cell adhesion molecule CEACAM4-like n=1 Tax=Notamacropus eugenii TaxID=9315 RepID=UPI003B670A76